MKTGKICVPMNIETAAHENRKGTKSKTKKKKKKIKSHLFPMKCLLPICSKIRSIFRYESTTVLARFVFYSIWIFLFWGGFVWWSVRNERMLRMKLHAETNTHSTRAHTYKKSNNEQQQRQTNLNQLRNIKQMVYAFNMFIRIFESTLWRRANLVCGMAQTSWHFHIYFFSLILHSPSETQSLCRIACLLSLFFIVLVLAFFPT